MIAEVHSAEEAIELLHLAQSRSSNWTTDREGHLQPVPNKAHLFIRAVVTDLAREQVSTLHMVDLAGSQNVSSHRADEQSHQEKLATNRQLLSFSNVVTELSRISSSQGAAASISSTVSVSVPMPATCCRHSVCNCLYLKSCSTVWIE